MGFLEDWKSLGVPELTPGWEAESGQKRWALQVWPGRTDLQPQLVPSLLPDHSDMSSFSSPRVHGDVFCLGAS